MIAFRSNLTAKINIKIQKQFTQLQRIKNVGSQRGPTNAAAVASNMWHPSMTCIHYVGAVVNFRYSFVSNRKKIRNFDWLFCRLQYWSYVTNNSNLHLDAILWCFVALQYFRATDFNFCFSWLLDVLTALEC